MTPFDIVVLIVVGLSGLFALIRGFTTTALSLAAWVGALILLKLLFAPVSGFMRGFIDSKAGADILAFLVVLVASLGGLQFLANLAGEKVKASGLGVLDRALGLIFGVARGLLIVALVWMGLSKLFDPKGIDWIATAKTLPAVEQSADLTAKFINFARDFQASPEAKAPKIQPEDPDTASAPPQGYDPQSRDAIGDLIIDTAEPPAAQEGQTKR
jgi:membrane protein required for colicin V production